MSEDETTNRASGVTPAVEEARGASGEMFDEISAGDDIDRVHREPRFHLMRFEMSNPEQRRTLREAQAHIDMVMVTEFNEAYRIIDEIQQTVRIPALNPATGEPMVDANGEVIWEKTPAGLIIEDYTRMARRTQEDYLGRITTRLFGWEQVAERMWMDAMLARSTFEEKFAISYDDLRGGRGKTTVDDRKAYANAEASLDRYYAVYATSLSRRGASLCRSMERIGQRLKDVLTS